MREVDKVNEPYKAQKQTYLTKDGKSTFTIYHPAVKFQKNEPFCCILDPSAQTGLYEHSTEIDAYNHAKKLYFQFKGEKL